MVSLTEKIKEKALDLGFHKVGVAPAAPLGEEEARLREWLARGFHAEMRWMEREPEKRGNPQILFPGARSVVAVALNYYTPHEHEENPAKGKVSRYAWGDDYHDVLQEKLRALLGWIKEETPGTDGKICADIQPLMDKAWAARAGLGWIGKHSNLITKEYGSWVFLGAIVLNVELESDAEPVENHCGTCTACLDACPTGAIVEPFLVDAGRCLSYATIELRSPELPNEISDNLNGWIYGCDVCQDVCPWNRFQKPTEETRFEPRAGSITIDLEAVSRLTHEEYVTRFRRSAMKRAKLAGLQRNARALIENNNT